MKEQTRNRPAACVRHRGFRESRARQRYRDQTCQILGICMNACPHAMQPDPWKPTLGCLNMLVRVSHSPHVHLGKMRPKRTMAASTTLRPDDAAGKYLAVSGIPIAPFCPDVSDSSGPERPPVKSIVDDDTTSNSTWPRGTRARSAAKLEGSKGPTSVEAKSRDVNPSVRACCSVQRQVLGWEIQR
jgi:hypothetical protein